MATRTITTRDAVVKTASIEVKALTIGGKQVTLSVFRQLRDEHLLDPETLDLRGVPWGIVNYRWGDCDSRGQDHLHVVWQSGEELRRACVDPDVRHDPAYRHVMDRLEGCAEAIAEPGFLLASLASKPTFIRPGGREQSRAGNWSTYLDSTVGQSINNFWIYQGLSPSPDRPDYYKVCVAEEALKVWKAIELALCRLEYRFPDIHARLGRVVNLADHLPTLAVLFTEVIERRIWMKATWLRRHSELSQLDHLFIAT